MNVVDHELTLKEDGNKDEWELKITYRGYTQSLITSPLMDAMQTEAELEEKITAENELVAAQALVAELKSRQFILEDLLAGEDEVEDEVEDDDEALGADEEMKREFSGAGAAGGYTLPLAGNKKNLDNMRDVGWGE